MITLHLNLKREWFDMIKQGIKKEEYRNLSKYWTDRFNKIIPSNFQKGVFTPKIDTITFSNGYATDRNQIVVLVKGMYIGEGKQEWGAIKGETYFVFILGDIIYENHIMKKLKILSLI